MHSKWGASGPELAPNVYRFQDANFTGQRGWRIRFSEEINDWTWAWVNNTVNTRLAARQIQGAPNYIYDRGDDNSCPNNNKIEQFKNAQCFSIENSVFNNVGGNQYHITAESGSTVIIQGGEIHLTDVFKPISNSARGTDAENPCGEKEFFFDVEWKSPSVCFHCEGRNCHSMDTTFESFGN